jgi:hypothetical protein
LQKPISPGEDLFPPKETLKKLGWEAIFGTNPPFVPHLTSKY